jgi:hypothetical protein
MTEFEKFPSIKNFHTLNKYVRRRFNAEMRPIIRYRPKIKVHGTNAGIRITPNGEVVAQKRTSDLGGDVENVGFSAWVQSNSDYWSSLKKDERIVVFGEWAGPGVQKGVACSQLENKMFFVFALLFNGETMLVDPSIIEKVMGEDIPDDVHVLPWAGEEVSLNYANTIHLQRSLDAINKAVEKIEQVDPYFDTTFNVQGTGEGLVYVPINILSEDGEHPVMFFEEEQSYKVLKREAYSEYTFKAKGEKHQVVRNKAPAQMDPEVAATIDKFLDLVVTENRLRQALTEVCGEEADITKMNDFLKWMGQDVKRECTSELEASGLEWKDVSKSVIFKCREWFISECEKLD